MTIVSYAQNFEDVMLWRVLHHVERGFYVDIGAQHPVIDSVSKLFYENGWRGINVEPSLAYANLIRADRPEDQVIQAAASDQATVLRFYEIPDTGLSSLNADVIAQHKERGYRIQETTTPCVLLDDVLELCDGRQVHWLKIDVEGHEKNVLQGWRKCALRPWIVVLESTRPLTKEESYTEWEPLLIDKGYVFVWFDGINRFYVHENEKYLAGGFGAPPNVFDGFSLSGTASSSFSKLLTSQLEREIDARANERAELLREAEVALEGVREAIVGKERELQDLVSTHAGEMRAINEARRQAEVLRAGEVSELETAVARLESELAISKTEQQAELAEFLRSVAEEHASRVSADAIRSRHEADLVGRIGLLSEQIVKREAIFAELQTQANLNSERCRQSQLFLSQDIERTRHELTSLRGAQELSSRRSLDEIDKVRRDFQSELATRVNDERKRVIRLAKLQAERTSRLKVQREQLQRQQARLLEVQSENVACSAEIRDARQELSATLLELSRREREMGVRFSELSDARATVIQAYELQLNDLKSSFREREAEQAAKIVAQDHRVRELESDSVAHVAMAKLLFEAHAQVRNSLDDAAGLHSVRLDASQVAYSCSEQYLAASTKLATEYRIVTEQVLRVLRDEVDEMRGTLSWRITRPLRMFGRESKRDAPSGTSSTRIEETFEHNLPTAKVAADIDADPRLPDWTADATSSNDPRMSVDHIQSTSNLHNDTYHVDDLLRLNSGEFVEHAYRAILNRRPDAEGLRYYLGRLGLGYSKVGILDQIDRSREARAANRHIHGMKRSIFAKCSAIPVVGRLIAAFDDDSDHESRRRIRRIENALITLDQRATQRFDHIDDQLAKLTDRLVDALKNMSMANLESIAAPSINGASNPISGEHAKELEARRLAPDSRRLFEQLTNTSESISCAS